MKTILSSLAFITLFSAAIAQDKYQVNTDNSSVAWHAEKVTGEHDGFVNIKSGTLLAKNGTLSGGSFVIDMTSISCTDIENEEYNTKLVNHLKSDDFFGVEKHPTAKLEITSVESDKIGHYEISGKMTIKGKTNDITFSASVNESGDMLKANAEIIIDRTKYDVRYGSGSFFDDLGDKTIYDEFTLKVALVTNKKNS